MIKITEILPNPEGKDGNNEWIELKNVGQAGPGHSQASPSHGQAGQQPQPVNLENYILDDIADGGSKPYTLPATVLQPNQTIVLYKSQTKINLNNSDDEVRLLSPDGKLIDRVSYGKSEEGSSYALTKILQETGEKSTYRWTTPTPNKENPPLYLFEGTITSTPEIKSDFLFQFQPETTATIATPTTAPAEKPLTITFSEETLDFETAKLIFQPQTKAKLLTSKITNSHFALVDYKIDQKIEATATNTTATDPTNQPPSFIFPILFIVSIFLILIIKLKKKKN